MYFSILGPLEVTQRDIHLTVRPGRPRSLLHLLIVNRRVVVPTDVIADRLWPTDPPQDVPNAVHQLLSYVRRALGTEGRELLSTSSSGYLLDAPDDAVDAWLFERNLADALNIAADADSADLRRGCAAADEAIKLWRGDPLAESAHLEWSAGLRAGLQDGYVQAHLTRLDMLLRLGRHREVVLDSQALAAAYPFREDFHHVRALALYRSGRQGEALESLRDVRALLARELGVDPGRNLQELERDILGQSDTLEWIPPRAEAGGGTPEGTPPRITAPPPSAKRWELVAPSIPVEPATTLIGREAELNMLASLAQPGAMVTVTGPAGVGKTRLLLALAAGRRDTTWFVDLTGASTDDDVALLVTESLVPTYTGANPVEALTSALRDAEATVMLDGCQHVMDGVRALIDSIRLVSDRLIVIVGSRLPCDTLDEHVHRVSVLPTPATNHTSMDELMKVESVHLFIDRARLARASFEPTTSDVEVISEIVTAVDGLPLAIELAASLLDVEDPPAVLSRLEQQLSTMPHARFSLPSRERTLDAAIEASASVLTPEERGLLTALGVFAGRFDLSAAAAVSGADESQTFASLVALTRQSLVVSLGDGTFQLLASVRSWARAASAKEPDPDLVRQRHASYICEIVWSAWQRGGGLRHRGALYGLAPVLPDARAALAWSFDQSDVVPALKIAVACSWVWTLQGKGEDGLRELQRVRTLAELQPLVGSDSLELTAALLRSIGLVANPVGRLALAEEVCSEAAGLYLQLGDNEQAAAAMLTLGIAEWAQGSLADARASLQDALDLTSDGSSSWNHAAAHVLLARTVLDQGSEDAEAYLDRALEAAQVAGDSHMHGLALACRSRWLLTKDDPSTAEVAAQEALRLWQTIEYLEGEVMALNLLSRCSAMTGQPDTAWTHGLHALELAQPANHRGGMCESLESLGLAAASLGRREQALFLLEVAKTERTRLGAPIPAADQRMVDGGMAALRTALGDASRLVAARATLSALDDIVDQLRGERIPAGR